MSPAELRAFRDRHGLSRAKLASLLTDPLTAETTTGGTIYRYEREVYPIPLWIDRAVANLEARIADQRRETWLRKPGATIGAVREITPGRFQQWDGTTWKPFRR